MSDQTVSIWQDIKKHLKQELPEASFETWIGDLELIDFQDGRIDLAAPNGFVKRGLEERYLEVIRSRAKRLSGEDKEIKIEISPSSNGGRNQKEKGLKPPSVSPDNGGNPQNKPGSCANGKVPLNAEYTFDTFVQSKSNQLASAASRAVAENPAASYNPLFLYSRVGLGKTHLLHAIGNYLRSENPTVDILYTSSERFAIEMIRAIRQNKTDKFRRKYRAVKAFLLDDVQFLEGKEGTQEELFHTFNELYGEKKQIVLTSDRSPQEFSDLQDRLVSRFRWGLVADIQPPNFETRMAILRKKSTQKGLKVDQNVLELIAARISTNVRALEGALIKAVAHANLGNGRLTLEQASNFLPEESKQEKELTVSAIKEAVAENYGFSVADLEGKSRKKEIAKARHIAVYLARELTDNSFPSLGNKFGDRDHSTVMHSHKKIKTQLQETPLLSEEISELKKELKERRND